MWATIEAREVLRTTDKQVVIAMGKRERRENKMGSWCTWHETEQEAFSHVEKMAIDKMKEAERTISIQKAVIAKLKDAHPDCTLTTDKS